MGFHEDRKNNRGKDLINYGRVEQALKRLAETDQLAADLKADVERSKLKAKAIHSACMVRVKGTVAEREAAADNAPEYQDAMDEYFKAIELYEGIRNERSRQQLVLEVWRSIPQEVRASDPMIRKGYET